MRDYLLECEQLINGYTSVKDDTPHPSSDSLPVVHREEQKALLQ